MKCEELMKKDVLLVEEGDTIQEAACRMRDANVGFLPVCDHDGKAIGTLTDRDIAIRVDADGRAASSCRVGEVMTRAVIACLPDDDLTRAEQLMSEHKKSRLLVTGADGVLEGVLSISDIVQFEGGRRAAATLRQVMSRETHF